MAAAAGSRAMRASVYLGATVALGLGMLAPSQGFAQYCQPYWTAEYKCMNGCGCPGGGGAVQPPPQQQPPPGPSPEVLALQRARAAHDRGDRGVVEGTVPRSQFVDGEPAEHVPSVHQRCRQSAHLAGGAEHRAPAPGGGISHHHRSRQPRRPGAAAAIAGGAAGYRAAHRRAQGSPGLWAMVPGADR